MVLGSLLGGALMVATLRLVVAPMHHWRVSTLDAMTQLERLDLDVERLRNSTLASTQRMKLFLQQVQKLHAVSTTRTGLVERAAAQSYREHARDRLREHFMALKEGILLQTSQRRRIDDARSELRGMNLTAELLLLRMDPDSAAPAMDDGSNISASSLLAKSIREIRATLMDHSVGTQNATMNELATHVERVLAGVGNFTRLSAPPQDHEHGILVYLIVLGVVGTWLWSVFTDERTRKTSFVFTTHRAFVRALSSLVIVERVGDSSDDEEY
jgi:hypothetical protein